MKKYFYFTIWFNLFLSFSFNNLSGQKNNFSDLKISANYHYGYLLPEYSFFGYLTNDAVKAVDIEMRKELWELGK